MVAGANMQVAIVGTPPVSIVGTVPVTPPTFSSVPQSGTASAPTAGTAVATIAAGSLPAGTYQIQVWLSVAGSTTAAADANNMNLKAGATTLIANLPYDAATSGATTNGGPYGPITRTLDGATNLTVNAVGNATAGSTYVALIVATRIA